MRLEEAENFKNTGCKNNTIAIKTTVHFMEFSFKRIYELFFFEKFKENNNGITTSIKKLYKNY